MKNRGWLISIFLSCFVGLGAQVPDSLPDVSPSTMELMSVFNPWLATTNPAGHMFNEVQPGTMSLNYTSELGDYKKVMQGDTLRLYSFRTERYKRIGKTFFYGNFAYDKSYERNCNYTNVNDPYRRTPYLLIDTMNRNDIIDREFFTLRGDISTPLFSFLNWGFSADMNAGLASQDRDPRPKNKVLNLALSSGLLLDLPYVSLGVNGLYSYYNEDIEVDIIEKNVHLAFLQLHGFDTYTYHIAGSFNRLYKRQSYGGEGQMNLKLGPISSLFGGKFLYVMETADDGRKAGDASWSYIKNDSDLEGNELEFFNVTTVKTTSSIHALNASYRLRYMVGAEILQRLEQVGEAGAVDWVDYGSEEKYASSIKELSFDYRFVLLKDDYKRNFEVMLGWRNLEASQAYYLPDMQDHYNFRILSGVAEKTFYYGKHELGIGAGVKIKKSLNFSRDFEETSFISEKLLIPDFHYLSSAYTAPSFEYSYAVSLNRLFDKFFYRSSISWYKGKSGVAPIPGIDGQKRIVFNFSAGVIF